LTPRRARPISDTISNIGNTPMGTNQSHPARRRPATPQFETFNPELITDRMAVRMIEDAERKGLPCWHHHRRHVRHTGGVIAAVVRLQGIFTTDRQAVQGRSTR
jgi:hypothetical protein